MNVTVTKNPGHAVLYLESIAHRYLLIVVINLTRAQPVHSKKMKSLVSYAVSTDDLIRMNLSKEQLVVICF